MIDKILVVVGAVAAFAISIYAAMKKSERAGRLIERNKVIGAVRDAKISHRRYDVDSKYADRVRDAFKR